LTLTGAIEARPHPSREQCYDGSTLLACDLSFSRTVHDKLRGRTMKFRLYAAGADTRHGAAGAPAVGPVVANSRVAISLD
jgi:hypothetical protein